MANILDYLDWRGDLTLSERAFNEVDNLILAEICYLDLSGFAPAGFETQQVTLREAWDAYFAAHPTTDMGVLVPAQIPVLVQKAAQTARFGSLRLLGYVNRIDEETQTQFSAMTMLLPDGSAYVAFRGTDDTIVGWKEDFNMAFTPEIPAQRYAADYLQQAAAALAFRPLLVGGHSKGGNLAVYAAVFCGGASRTSPDCRQNYDAAAGIVGRRHASGARGSISGRAQHTDRTPAARRLFVAGSG